MAPFPKNPEAARLRFVPDPVAVIVVCAVALTILGLTVLFSASASFKQGPYYYLGKQLGGVAASALLCFVMSRINLDYVRRYAWWVAAVIDHFSRKVKCIAVFRK